MPGMPDYEYIRRMEIECDIIESGMPNVDVVNGRYTVTFHEPIADILDRYAAIHGE